MQNALITGGAGFIGSHLSEKLLDLGWRVTVVDNFDPFYNSLIKEVNVRKSLDLPCYQLIRADIRDFNLLKTQLSGNFDVVIHLAAKAGVRPSIQDPLLYQQVNIEGTQNLLELCRLWGTKHFIFASSSSVYGVNPHVPWREDDHVLLPVSPYAATKVSGELLGHVYSHLYGIRFLALRFFTVYGPRQRPDLAIHKFARLMLDKKPIPVYGDGNSTRRDYTYIEDIIKGILAAINYQGSLYEIINLGNNKPVTLNKLIASLEDSLGIKAQIERFPEQPGDVPQTFADLTKAKEMLGYQPETELEAGLLKFASWIRDFPISRKC